MRSVPSPVSATTAVGGNTTYAKTESMRRYLNGFYDRTQKEMEKKLFGSEYQIVTAWKVIDHRFYQQTKIDVQACCIKNHSDWLVEVNRTRQFNFYEQIAGRVLAGLKPRRYIALARVDRDNMEA